MPIIFKQIPSTMDHRYLKTVLILRPENDPHFCKNQSKRLVGPYSTQPLQVLRRFWSNCNRRSVSMRYDNIAVAYFAFCRAAPYEASEEDYIFAPAEPKSWVGIRPNSGAGARPNFRRLSFQKWRTPRCNTIWGRLGLSRRRLRARTQVVGHSGHQRSQRLTATVAFRSLSPEFGAVFRPQKRTGF